MSLKRRNGQSENGLDWAAVAGEEFVFGFPCVLEFLSRQSWEGGVARVPGTMMVFYEQGRWKLWVHDRDASESCFLSGTSLEEVLRSLEGILSEGGGDWRPDKGQRPGIGRKGS